MLVLLELLEHPILAKFELKNSTQWLYNQVSNIALLQWERTHQEMVSFAAKDFVLTTITVHQPAEIVWPRIRMLLQRRVAAVAIKGTCQIPEEILAEADICGVALFTFPLDVYTEDIIYAVRGTLDKHTFSKAHTEKLLRLIPDAHDAGAGQLRASEFNHFFFPNFCCCMCRPLAQSEEARASLIRSVYQPYLRSTQKFSMKNVIYSPVFLSGGIVVILTWKDAALEGEKVMGSLLNFLGLSPEHWQLSLSQSYLDADHLLGHAILECIYLSIDADASRRNHAATAGIRGLLPSVAFSPEANHYFDQYYPVVESYDCAHGSALIQTLTDYFENGMDMAATARIQCQHTNTIRYRIEKIKRLLDIPNTPDSNCQLYIFYHLLKSRTLLAKLKQDAPGIAELA